MTFFGLMSHLSYNCMKSMQKIEMSANYSRYLMNDEVHDAEIK